ncbi:MAG TPA: hypothetical protein PKA06_16600 [Gemmatales bacterium]|nr:hypothetical protein [Gemmatales bacterium]HMP18703.1 hypothetical protein [Gemmatales bacterium]
MRKFCLTLMMCLTCSALLVTGCSSNKGVELNKETSKAFNSATDMPAITGPGGGGDTGGGLNKGKKPSQ